MSTSKLQEKVSNSFHRFCDGTDMHGFNNLYYAKTVFWKTVWVIIICGSIGITAYQVSRAIDQYVHQSSTTLIQPATENELTYPPLKFCIAHWLHWIDWKRAFKMNFTREAILVGMSYLTNVYSNETFNITDAIKAFNDSMKLNNLTSITSFYFKIAKRLSISDLQFNDREFLETDLDNINFCYIANGTELLYNFQKQEMDAQHGKERQIEIVVSSTTFDTKGFITEEEYDSYMAEWIYARTQEYYLNEGTLKNYALVTGNYSKVQPPNLLFIDGYSDDNINLLSEIDIYYIRLTAQAQRSKNKVEKICNFGVKQYSLSNDKCNVYCRYMSYVSCGVITSPMTLLSAIRSNSTTDIANVSKIYKVFFLNQTEEISTKALLTSKFASTISKMYITNLTVTPRLKTTPKRTTYSCNYTIVYNSCMTENCSREGCEKWTYSVTLTTRSLYNSIRDVAHKSRTTILIRYPISSEVLIMTEIDSKTWEDFIGNVGGLLGIWTGASIVSFFQLLYLCCCADIQSCTQCCPHKTVSIDTDSMHHIVRRKRIIATKNSNALFV